MAPDSTSLADLLLFFPEIRRELDSVLEDAVGKVAKLSFQFSKDRVIIAEAFLKKMPDLDEDYKKDLVALIKGAGNTKELKAHLKPWESSITGGSSSVLSSVVSFFSSKDQTSKYLDEAVKQSRNTKDQEFLAILPEKVIKEPLLEQLAQDVVLEAHGHFREFMKKRLSRLYTRAGEVQRRTMYHQVEAEGKDQDQTTRVSARCEWLNEVKISQSRVDSGYVPYVKGCILSRSSCALAPGIQYLSVIWRK